jgi:hypothetical protein
MTAGGKRYGGVAARPLTGARACPRLSPSPSSGPAGGAQSRGATRGVARPRWLLCRAPATRPGPASTGHHSSAQRAWRPWPAQRAQPATMVSSAARSRACEARAGHTVRGGSRSAADPHRIGRFLRFRVRVHGSIRFFPISRLGLGFRTCSLPIQKQFDLSLFS